MLSIPFGKDAVIEDQERSPSVAERISRPLPCRKRMTASGTAYDMKDSPWRRLIFSEIAMVRGWVGTGKGRRVMMTISQVSPGTSMPSQKLSVPEGSSSGLP